MAEHTPEHRFDAPEADDSSAGFLRMVWQRKALVALGVVVGLVAGTLVYVQRAPVY